MVPNWEEVLIYNEIYSYFLQREEGDPEVIVFFEVCSFEVFYRFNKIIQSHLPEVEKTDVRCSFEFSKFRI